MASCVVFDKQGPLKPEYRRFSITGITGGDDYAAMAQALEKRYKHANSEKLPDILFIDGGKGQLQRAFQVMSSLKLTTVLLIGVAKGVGRKAGLEKLVLVSGAELFMPSTSKALNLVLYIRDEAHRFAVYSHRQKRDRQRKHSVLEEIAGIGSKKRQLLLRQFGGLQEISRAGVDDLMQVNGIHRKLAQQIYDRFHS